MRHKQHPGLKLDSFTLRFIFIIFWNETNSNQQIQSKKTDKQLQHVWVVDLLTWELVDYVQMLKIDFVFWMHLSLIVPLHFD